MAIGHGLVTEVARDGTVAAPNVHRFELLRDCSLLIHQPVLGDARLYSCDSGTLNSSVSLRTLELIENPTPPAVDSLELQCFLNTYTGHIPCKNTGIHMKWSTEDGTTLNGNRFRLENPSECFSKLIIKKQPTDHRRKWKCQVTHDNVVKATVSYTTTIADGVEEVFAAVGESVSVPCGPTSPLGVRGSAKWEGGRTPLTGDQSEAFHVNHDSSLFFRQVSALDAGDYQCSESTGDETVLHKVRVHTLDVTAQCEPGGNLTLTCVLTCSEKCEKDFNLTWSGFRPGSWQSVSVKDDGTLTNKLLLPLCPTVSDGITCSVQRAGAVMSSKQWRSDNSLRTPAWSALPLGLLICVAAAAAAGLYIKRKRDRDAVNDQSGIGMTHVYDVIQDVHNEDQKPSKEEATTNADSLYHLLEAVH